MPIFPKPYESFNGGISFKLHLSNYATKTDLKGAGATGVHPSDLATNSDLDRLKAEVDKIDVDKLKNYS